MGNRPQASGRGFPGLCLACFANEVAVWRQTSTESWSWTATVVALVTFLQRGLHFWVSKAPGPR